MLIKLGMVFIDKSRHEFKRCGRRTGHQPAQALGNHRRFLIASQYFESQKRRGSWSAMGEGSRSAYSRIAFFVGEQYRKLVHRVGRTHLDQPQTAKRPQLRGGV